jgi:IS5 family transposase
LPPASYRYLKTWEGSVDADVKESAVSKELINEENGKMEEEREHDMRLVEGKEELTETQRWQLKMRMLDRRGRQLMLMNEQMARQNDMEASRIKKEETDKLPRRVRAGSGYGQVNNNFDL